MKKREQLIFLTFLILTGLWGTAYGISNIDDLDDAALFSFSIMGDHKANSPNQTKMARMIQWNKQHHEFCIGMGDHANGQVEVPANDMDQTRHNPFLKFMAEDSWFGKHFYPNIGDHDNQINPEENPGDKKQVWGAGWVMFNYVGNPQDDYLYNNDIPMGTAPFFNRENVEFRPANGPKVPCTKSAKKYDDKLVDYYAWFDHSTHSGIPSGYTVHLISLSFGNMQMLAPQSAQFMENKLLELDAVRTDKDIIIVAVQNHDWVVKAERNGWLTSRQVDLLMTVADLTVEGNHHKYQWVNDYHDEYNERGALCINGGSVTAETQTGTGFLDVHVLANPTRITVQYINTATSTRKLHKGDITVSSRLPKYWTSPYMKEVNGGKITRIDDWGDIDISGPPPPPPPPQNNAPKFVKDSFSLMDATVGVAYDRSILTRAEDADGDALTYDLLSGPSWLSMSSNGRRVQGTPGSSDDGLNQWTVEVSDGVDTDTATMKITVNQPATPDWVELTNDDFENGVGSWVLGGVDAKYKTNNDNAVNGGDCIDIEDNNGNISSIWLANNLNLTGKTDLKIEFSYVGISMEAGEDFKVYFSSNGRSNWSKIADYDSGDEFENGVRENAVIEINSDDYTFNSSANIRFRCDATSGADDVYIDNIRISAR